VPGFIFRPRFALRVFHCALAISVKAFAFPGIRIDIIKFFQYLTIHVIDDAGADDQGTIKAKNGVRIPDPVWRGLWPFVLLIEILNQEQT
ncbi:hypothetical protein ACMWQD_28400, partial [Escherichia coli]|uniref:hypothetical protein n=1 Tax=Escherichia coli TaxID=562 RepID=UPI0039DFDB9F